MLRSRKRASSSPASNRPPSASASLAATKAFLRDRESNGALSSAAAAAALRTHATSPTPVGETVTKRMVRKASISSQGSGSQRPGLRRHSSSGSMTERSFRAPSPAGSSSPVDHDAPPVPAMPKNVPQVSVVKRRNSSLEPPIRGGSPAGRGGGRGVSLDRGVSTASPSGRGHPRSSPLSKVVEDDQDAGHRSSINFSRPISPPPVPSPTLSAAAPARGARGGWFAGPVVDSEQMFRGEKPRPKTSDGTAAYATQQAGQNAAARPVSTKTIQTGVEGARLAAGSMRAKPSGTHVSGQPTHTAAKDRPVRIVDPSSPFAVYDPSSRKFIHKQDAMNLHRAMSDVEEREPPYDRQQMAHRVQQEVPRYSQPARQASQSQKMTQQSNAASLVREDPPTEYIDPPTRQGQLTASEPEDTHGVAFSHDEHTAFTAEEFAEAEDRLPADANTSRKLESSVPHRTEEAEQMVSPKFAPNQGSSYPRLAPPSGPTSSNPPSLKGSTRSSRTHSMSPPRNAHFAAVAAVEFPDGVKHQPPGRSVSPAKSALKASPSVSRRSHSPLANDSRVINRGVPSEISDAVSEDGSKKKKKVRISFEEEPIVLGTSAYADTQLADASDSFDMDQEEDPDDFMRPRPVLPSFGSIRDKNRRSRDEELPEKVTETVSSSLSNSATLMGDSQEMSSDHKIGGILAHDFGAKQVVSSGHNDPLPPEVTTVEGSGYWSDSDKSEDAQIAPPVHFSGLQKTNVPQSSLDPEPKTLADPIEIRSTPLEVPVIAVQPASPPLPQESATEPILFATPVPAPAPQPKLKERRSFVPGGWDDDDVSEPEVEAKEPTLESAIPAHSHSSITIQIPERPVDDDSSDDNSSVYSDAYEDIEEGEGFGSIDAIMESPVQPPTSRFASNTSSPVEQRTHKPGLESSRWAPVGADEQEQPKSQTGADWEKSQQYWSDLNDSRRQQPQNGLLIDKLALAGEPEVVTKEDKPAARTTMNPSDSVQKEKSAPASKTVRPQERTVKVEPVVTQSKTTTPPAKSSAQPRKSALKKPVTTAPPAEVPMKKTMRNQAPVANRNEPQMRMTMRGTGGGFAGRGSSAPAAHRQSLPPLDTKPPRGALQKKHLPAAAAGVAVKPRPQSSAGVPVRAKPTYQAPAYESDSDASVSSFQRERRRNRGSRQSNGSYTMRSSMRSGPTPTMRATPPVRSISPPRNAMPASQSTLKKSMRPSSPTPESPKSVKSSRFSIRSLSPGGRFRRNSFQEAAPPVPSVPVQLPPPMRKTMFAKQSEPKKPVSKAPARTTKAFKSRFNDSSDEEEDRPRRFQSRFADSDSEDEDLDLPTGLTPVRGIPKRPGEEDRDSTDLEDEASDNETSPAPVTNGADKDKQTATNGTSSMQGTTLAAGSLRKPDLPSFDGGKKAKRGFFGLGKKKNSHVEADPQASTNLDIPMPPAQQNRDRNRPLTPIGEDRDIDAGEVTTSPPKAGRQAPFERSTSDSWPLPPPNPGFAGNARPQSADGPLQRNGPRRPTLMKRNSSQISQARTEVDMKTGKTVAYGKTGKKKKFQGLRRVFGLND